MEYAVKVSGIVNAFSQEPLETGQMDMFYCNGTMEYRTDDKYNSPVVDIFEECQDTGNVLPFCCQGTRDAEKVQN